MYSAKAKGKNQAQLYGATRRAAGADGLLIEVHPVPEQAVSDGDQSLMFDEFDALMAGLEPVAAAVGRSL